LKISGHEETLHGGAGVMDYGNLIWITLQRSKTAREAILTFDQLVKDSSCPVSNSWHMLLMYCMCMLYRYIFIYIIYSEYAAHTQIVHMYMYMHIHHTGTHTQRCKQIAQEYGYVSEGESFTIADPHDAGSNVQQDLGTEPEFSSPFQVR
jgi:hypothetical protein